MQEWEYKTVLRTRGWKGSQYKPYRGDKWNVNIQDTLNELGPLGWELVSVSSRCGVLGTDTDYADYAGFTDEELWVFKRPKQ